MKILTVAGLSFIGLGIQPPIPEWGSMLSSGRSYIRDYPHMTLYPGGAIMITIFALNLPGDGHENILFILSRGDLIGEIDLFSESSHDYQVTALDETVVKIISKEIVNNEISLDLNIYQYVIKSIIRKNQIMCSQIMDCSFKSSEAKIASILIRLAEQDGKYIDDHLEFLYLKHQDLADLLGCSRVTISKTFNKLKADSSIEFIDKKAYILNIDKLKKYIP